MDWMTILKIALVIGCGVGLYYLCIYSYAFWNMAEALCKFIEIGIDFITIPFKKLFMGLKDSVRAPSFSFKVDAIGRFANRHPTLGTERSIKFFIIAFIYLVIVFTVRILNGGMGDFLQELINMFPFIFVINSFSGANEFTLVGIISTGISALLMGAFFNFCVGDFERKGHFLRWIVSIPYYIVTTLLGCYFGLVLSHVWEWAAKSGVTLFNTFCSTITATDKSFLEIIVAFFSFLALLVLIYIGIVLLLYAIREYLDTFIYGLIGILLIIVYLILCLVLGGQAFLSTPLFATIATILGIFAILGVDFMRVNKGELLGTDKF